MTYFNNGSLGMVNLNKLFVIAFASISQNYLITDEIN